jgi:hypothetical protein
VNIGSFFSELKRRNVYKAAIAYAVVSWLAIQAATQVFPFFDVPNWAVRLVVLLLVLGFPAALIFAGQHLRKDRTALPADEVSSQLKRYA